MQLEGRRYHNAIIAILILSILGLLFSVLIEAEKMRYEKDENGICSAITGTDGCKTVQTSVYGETLGIDNPWIGMIGFASMTVLASVLIFKKNLSRKTRNSLVKVLIAGSMIAGLVVLWFLYVQQFILHKYCLFCLFVDFFSLALAGIAGYLLCDRLHK